MWMGADLPYRVPGTDLIVEHASASLSFPEKSQGEVRLTLAFRQFPDGETQATSHEQTFEYSFKDYNNDLNGIRFEVAPAISLNGELTINETATYDGWSSLWLEATDKNGVLHTLTFDDSYRYY